mgnify:CR=1 FL=1
MSNLALKLTLSAMLLAGCTRNVPPVCEASGHLDDSACATSILNLIASPRTYQAKVISVAGFADRVTDGNREAILLYPTRETRAMQSTTVAVRVFMDGRPLAALRQRSGTDVSARVTGVFSVAANGQGILGEIRATR